jgi:hypothetical protein
MTSQFPIPNILDRAAGYLTLQFRNDSNILGYRIRVANSLDNAYGPFNGVVGTGTTALFDVNRGQTFISRPIRIRRTAIMGDTTRGQTRATYDPNEFFGLSPEVPADSQIAFMRVQVRTVASPTFPGAATAANQSDILVVQDPAFFDVPRPAITLAGTAPDLATAVAGLPAPPEALVFRLPAFGDAMVFTNTGGSPLLFATGLGQPLISVPAGEVVPHQGGLKDELVICASGANPTFSVVIACVSGMR